MTRSTAADVDEFLEQAQAVDMRTLAREGMPEALEYLHQRQAQQLAESPRRRPLTGPRHAELDVCHRASHDRHALARLLADANTQRIRAVKSAI